MITFPYKNVTVILKGSNRSQVIRPPRTADDWRLYQSLRRRGFTMTAADRALLGMKTCLETYENHRRPCYSYHQQETGGL